MKSILKTLPALCATALCLTSDSATSSSPVSPVENLSSASTGYAVTIPMLRSSVSPSWVLTACVPPKR